MNDDPEAKLDQVVVYAQVYETVSCAAKVLPMENSVRSAPYLSKIRMIRRRFPI